MHPTEIPPCGRDDWCRRASFCRADWRRAPWSEREMTNAKALGWHGAAAGCCCGNKDASAGLERRLSREDQQGDVVELRLVAHKGL
jgi:hypothetical protein